MVTKKAGKSISMEEKKAQHITSPQCQYAEGTARFIAPPRPRGLAHQLFTSTERRDIRWQSRRAMHASLDGLASGKHVTATATGVNRQPCQACIQIFCILKELWATTYRGPRMGDGWSVDDDHIAWPVAAPNSSASSTRSQQASVKATCVRLRGVRHRAS